MSIRSQLIEDAAKALLADVRRRYPNEELRCPYMIALALACQDEARPVFKSEMLCHLCKQMIPLFENHRCPADRALFHVPPSYQVK